ncbi:MAG: hypothetical protein GY871_04220 [Actinomycetales bacterium]|nr:hypothetical protein [Actinomycetales bacterium]
MDALSDFESIRPEMRWKGPALGQFDKIRGLMCRLDLPWKVVGSHRSKSVRLPVIRVDCEGIEIYLRDNFRDVNVCVVSQEPVNLPLSEMFEDILRPLDWGWYLAEVSRKRGYTWKEWSDEQMGDPDLLQLPGCKRGYSIRTAEEKLRWIKRLEDPEWFHRDWSGSSISWEGEFGPGVTMWVQRRAFLEGIQNLVPIAARQPYKRGSKAFSLASSWEGAELLIKRLQRESA